MFIQERLQPLRPPPVTAADPLAALTQHQPFISLQMPVVMETRISANTNRVTHSSFDGAARHINVPFRQDQAGRSSSVSRLLSYAKLTVRWLRLHIQHETGINCPESPVFSL